ncbi:MAG: peptide chain release factor N(5)-glutamine methyltransferase [Acidobacteriota bacterium]
MTIREALRRATRELDEQNLRSPRQDAELILMSVLECSRAFLFTHPGHPLAESQSQRFEEWLQRRLQHYPLQYLRGHQEFYGREFVVTPAVLVPRPETELLVEVALEALTRPAAARVVEVGSGSGCLGLSLVCQNPRLRLTATDISEEALEVTRLNAERLDCLQRVETLQGDGLRPVLDRGRIYDLLVSNPPYGSTREEDRVDPGVLRHEPRQAVFAGESGLEVYQKIFQDAHRILRPSAAIAVELGYGQAEAVRKLALERGWKLIELRQDLAGIDRVAVFLPAGKSEHSAD